MSSPEPGWEQRPGAPNVFTRPLIGSELYFDQSMRLQDGVTQFAIGIQFSTTIYERDIKARVEEAIVRLRFECPLVGATIERGIHHPAFGSWTYAPLATPEAARAWASQTVHYLPDSVQDPSSFLQSTVETHKLPYVLADGSEQYLRVYLTRPAMELNVYCLSLHAAHSVVDAKPALHVLSLLLEWMTASETELARSIADLPWGTEHRNLPPGPVTVTGGPREDWSTQGTALMQKFKEVFAHPTPSHGLEFARATSSDGDSSPGNLNVHRFLVKFTMQESAKIAQCLKTLGFTFSELLDAACVVATFEHNPVPADKVESAHIKGGSPITLTDRLPAPISRRTHLVSALVFAPFRFAYSPLSSLPVIGRARLLAAMRLAKQQYAWCLANPCLPHLLAELAPHIAQTVPVTQDKPEGTYAPLMSNVGRVEDYVAPAWPRGGGGEGGGEGGAVIRVEDMHMACRLGGEFFKPMLHGWSIQGRLSVLLEASGVWDKEVLQDFFNGIARQISSIIED